MSERLNAYIALTKPRLIELLRVTTVPAMVLGAVRMATPPDLPHFGWLVAWTLIGGTLAAGSARFTVTDRADAPDFGGREIVVSRSIGRSVSNRPS